MPPPDGKTRQSASDGLFRALAEDLGPARAELLKLLDLPEAERPAAARELLGRLDELLPDDPAMAAVLSEEMASAFAEGAGEEAAKNAEGAKTGALANEREYVRGGDPKHSGRFSKNCVRSHYGDKAAETVETALDVCPVSILHPPVHAPHSTPPAPKETTP